MKKIFIFSIFILFGFIGLVCWQLFQFYDGKLHVVFCDVGQGDAILITTPSRKRILVDGGVDESIFACLSAHMPFWERRIDLMILSHPHADHLNGLVSVLDRYTISYFATEPLKNDTAGFKELLRKIKEKRVTSTSVLAGIVIRIGDGVVIRVVGPTQEYLDQTSPKGSIGESAEFGSIIQQISYGNVDVLLDGDSQVSGMKQAQKKLNGQIEVLQVPHHGSRFGLDKALVDELAPKVAIFSVGKNMYGHPAPSMLTLLQNAGIQYFRTDEDGDVEIVSDGKTFLVK
jgi:competence protein ComEC